MAETPQPQMATISRVQRFNAQGDGWSVHAYDQANVVAYSCADLLQWLRQEGNGFYVIQYEGGTGALYSVNNSIVFRITNVEDQPVPVPVLY